MTGARSINIAVMAIGGQGGGVLSGWIVEVGERAGYRAQYTSVPGVAQRTGATIYYIELFPEREIQATGREPVLALMPVPGDVDILIASELMEAGRAMLRGFVTPDRTTFIASTHRVYSIGEKSALGDGRMPQGEILRAAEEKSKALISFDMQSAAEEAGSVISAVMFGALAGSGALGIDRLVFEEVIKASGRMVEANLKAFAAGYERARGEGADAEEDAEKRDVAVDGHRLLRIARSDFPAAAQEVIVTGLERVVDYQDEDYGELYLERLRAVAKSDRGGEDHLLLRETARYLALAMTYEDTIRVADLKTRDSRFARVREEVRAGADQLVEVSEFLHPRVEEICDTLPAPVGAYILERPGLQKLVAALFARGRRVKTTTILGFAQLYFIARLRRFRRGTYRFKVEDQRIESWLARVMEAALIDQALGVEVARCQRLVRGYGDTHARGLRRYGQLMETYERIKHEPDAAQTLAGLRAAAMADEAGEELADALKKVA